MNHQTSMPGPLLRSQLDGERWLIDLDEAARLLDVSRSTMEGWVRTKAIASFKQNRRVRRIPLVDLARFVLLNTVKPRRPDWATGAVESEFRELLGKLTDARVEKLLAERGQRLAACRI